MMDINRLGTMKEHRFGLTAHCLDCQHFGPVDIDRLIDRFGPDFNTVDGHHQILAVIRCAKCAGKRIELRLKAPSGFDGGGRR